MRALFAGPASGRRCALRLIRALGAEIRRAMATSQGGWVILDDWYWFLAPFYPWLRLERRARGGRILLVYSPVTSHLFWFLRNRPAVLFKCRDFSLWRGRKLVQEAWSYLSSDLLSVQSEGLAEAYRGLRPRRPVIVTPNALLSAGSGCAIAERPAEPGRRVRLIYAGNLSYNKGVDLILALDEPAFLERFEVTLVGGAYRREGREIAARLAASRFRRLPWQGPAALARLFADSDILILPSLHEGMPRVVCEFLALGKPVVATDLPGLSDVRSPLLVRFAKGDLAQFRQAIEGAARLIRADAALLAANREALARFSIEDTGRVKAERLLSALGERADPRPK